MARALRAVFDGEVLRPKEPVDLKPNTRYVVAIKREEEGEETGEEGTYGMRMAAWRMTEMGPDLELVFLQASRCSVKNLLP